MEAVARLQRRQRTANRNLTASRDAMRTSCGGAQEPTSTGVPSWSWIRAAFRSSAAAFRRKAGAGRAAILILGAEHDRLAAPTRFGASRPSFRAPTRNDGDAAHEICATPIRSACARSRGSTPSGRACGGAKEFDVATIGAGMAGRACRRNRRRRQGADPRSGGPARLSRHRPLCPHSGGNYAAADPAADQRLAPALAIS